MTIVDRRRVCGIAAAVMMAVPAFAQAPSAGTAPPPLAQARQLRNFTLRNFASQPIEQATARMTSGADATITAHGRILPAEAQSFSTNNGGCLDSVAVRFTDGHALQARHLNDCTSTTVVVRSDKISLTNSAGRGPSSPALPSNR